MKKILSFVLLFIVVFSTFVHANEEQILNDSENVGKEVVQEARKVYIVTDKGEDSKRPTTCPYGNGICEAKSKGTANVFIDGELQFSGSCWQCTKCYTIYVTYYDPLACGYIGDYAVASWYEEIPGYGASNVNVNSTGFTNSGTLEGVHFTY